MVNNFNYGQSKSFPSYKEKKRSGKVVFTKLRHRLSCMYSIVYTLYIKRLCLWFLKVLRCIVTRYMKVKVFLYCALVVCELSGSEEQSNTILQVY